MNPVKPGWKTSEFWIHILAHFAPMLAGYLMNTFAPGEPIAIAAVAIVTSVAGQYGASQYSDDRTTAKAAPAAPVTAPVPAPVPTPVAPPAATK